MNGGLRQLVLMLRAVTIDLSNRDHGLLGCSRIATSFANWCFAIALGVYGFEAHGALGVGLVAMVRLLPGALASPFAGMLSDRFPRRSVMLGASLAMAVILVGATIAASLGAPTSVVFIFPALFAVAASGYGPAESALGAASARTPRELAASNVTHAAMDNTGFMIGALVTGLLLTSHTPTLIFGVAAAAMVITTGLLVFVRKDKRPDYHEYDTEVAGVLDEVSTGFRSLGEHPAMRLIVVVLAMLIFFEGFADVLLVVMALDLLHLAEGSVGFLTAAWGVGALIGGSLLTLLLDRGRLVVAIAAGSILLGAATMLPGLWPVVTAAYIGWIAIGIGFTWVEVAAKTLLHRFSSDETLGRVLSTLESARLAAMALGAISATAAEALLHTRGALIFLGALMPIFVLACWTRLRAYEVGAPVADGPYRLLRENSIFAPLPIATVERLSHDLVAVEIPAGNDVIVQGEIGDRFYLIERGKVEVFENGAFRRNEGPGESFGEIALLHDVPRTATVRTTEPTRMLVLEREQFLAAVTGHRRSQQLAHSVVDDRWESKELISPAPE